MKTLSIRQPWALLVVLGIKPVENRTWSVHYRGPLQIHASAKLDRAALDSLAREHRVAVDVERLRFGGIIGRVNLLDVKPQRDMLHAIATGRFKSAFYTPTDARGRPHFGWLLTEARELPFTPCAGLQSLFETPEIRP